MQLRIGSKKIDSCTLLIALLYLFIFENFFGELIPYFKYFDELVAMMAVPIYISDKDKRIGNIGIIIALLMLLGTISSVWFHYQSYNAILVDGICCVKMWLAIYVGEQLFRNIDVKKSGGRLYKHVFILSTFLAIVVVFAYVTDYWGHSERYGFIIVSPFGVIMSCLVMSYCLLIEVLFMIAKYKRRCYVQIFALLVLMVITMRSKAFGIAIVAIYIYIYILRLNKIISIQQLVIMSLIVTTVAYPMIYYYYFGPLKINSARAQLTEKCVEVANSHFPFGAGFGTFGSNYASDFYSPIYLEYGFEQIKGMGINDGYYLKDTFWPIIIGEFGWLGLALFVMALVLLMLKIKRTAENINLGYYAAGLLIILAELINSTSETAFMGSYIVSHAVILGLIMGKERLKCKGDSDDIGN